MSGLAELEVERGLYQEQPSPQLDLVLAQLRDDPDNAELKNLEQELKNFVDLLNENIAELKPKQAPKPTSKQPSPPPEPEKWSRENHPAFKKAAPPPPEEKDDTPVAYQVNDTVMAKWMSGDKGLYPAKITSITGSAAAPVYVVKFKSYDNTETLRSRDIRPISNKRKAEAPPPPPLASTPGLVSSAGATTYPTAGKDAAAEAKPPKPKKIKAKKELEAGKNKWQEFNSKSKFGKTQKKDSMFRTPEGIRGRVGFTGSGQAMRKDPSRNRHVYQVNEDLD
ncbi:Tudor domain protein [Cordyceps fumosorosea ARSEF 2679]|uniref:Tudor domain protein n=1 Tax=Cordyceps fumosorosea (strain ARSEF 2679) TaxID=1081104 RepID=A0A168BUG6_CORFA|nr:Tudor domain protein [Cordyceps fumosorosea ARSEF 2679]OAA70565.1 Tudor domain protein [Cordyceps fumosorosea ARSEF 2679]